MLRFEIIRGNSEEWDKLVQKSFYYDFYHTRFYHILEGKKREEPLLFVAKSGRDFVAFPLMLRPIRDTGMYDCTSVYGYCGPISSSNLVDVSKDLLAFFRESFISACKELNVVSVFSRLHMNMHHEDFLRDFGVVKRLNQVVQIDLRMSREAIRRGYRKSTKSEINQLVKRKGYTCSKVEPTDKRSVEEFILIYNDTMNRVGAKKAYFYDTTYILSFLRSEAFNAELYCAYKDNVMVAGAIFVNCRDSIQYHLAGTHASYLQDTPMKLIIDKAISDGLDKGLIRMNLGGGLTSDENDSLFRFKRGFSKNFKTFCVWNLIVDQVTYEDLVTKNISASKSDFFPLYRA